MGIGLSPIPGLPGERFIGDDGLELAALPVSSSPAPSSPVTLLTDADTTSDAAEWAGGDCQFTAWGTWDGATAQLQWSPDDGSTWIDVDGAGLTENGGVIVSLPAGSVRAAISDAGTTSLNADLRRV